MLDLWWEIQNIITGGFMAGNTKYYNWWIYGGKYKISVTGYR
jgi:hypothetical protein